MWHARKIQIIHKEQWAQTVLSVDMSVSVSVAVGVSMYALNPVWFLPHFIWMLITVKKKIRRISYVFATERKSTFHYKFRDYASSYLLHIQIYAYIRKWYYKFSFPFSSIPSSHFFIRMPFFQFNDFWCASNFEWVAFFFWRCSFDRIYCNFSMASHLNETPILPPPISAPTAKHIKVVKLFASSEMISHI